ncbi:MAG: hypothetical protein R3178_07410, partial [Rhodothermales bacterium]|nr:hypothetical protein [Rhodothermales bacterium]
MDFADPPHNNLLLHAMWSTLNPSASHRVVVTRRLPGTRWMTILTQSDCRVETWTSESPPGP